MDYNTELSEERERIYQLLKMLKEAGVPVNGVVLQAHWSVFEPEQMDLVTTIEKFASPCLKVQITEPDVSV